MGLLRTSRPWDRQQAINEAAAAWKSSHALENAAGVGCKHAEFEADAAPRARMAKMMHVHARLVGRARAWQRRRGSTQRPD